MADLSHWNAPLAAEHGGFRRKRLFIGSIGVESMFPFTNQVDLHTHGPKPVREKRHWDDEGFEKTQRRVGSVQCPCCGLWWPSIEEPDCWQENPETGRNDAIGWWGGTTCEECGLLMIEQPDGTAEVYDLSVR